jgi:mRNA interferase HigB
MHVIAKPPLVAFWTKHPDAEHSLNTWYRLMQKEAFTDFNHLRATFPSADQVGKLTVFNIGGNKYRLITEIYYAQRVVLIREVLTHAEYDRNKWK